MLADKVRMVGLGEVTVTGVEILNTPEFPKTYIDSKWGRRPVSPQTFQLEWRVIPSNASIKDVTFTLETPYGEPSGGIASSYTELPDGGLRLRYIGLGTELQIDSNGLITYKSIASAGQTEYRNMPLDFAVRVRTVDGGFTDRVIGVSPVESFYCFVEGTKINLPDGSWKMVEDIDYGDIVSVWNFDKGVEDEAEVFWVSEESVASHYFLVTLSDGTELKLVGPGNKSHRLLNVTQGKFMYPQEFEEGDNTVKQDGSLVSIDKIEKVNEDVKYYNFETFGRSNTYANDILCGSRFANIYPIDKMKYVKDNREFNTKDDFEGIPDEYYYGLRLAEQPLNPGADDFIFSETTREHIISNYIRRARNLDR